jgi:hypothetical protein
MHQKRNDSIQMAGRRHIAGRDLLYSAVFAMSTDAFHGISPNNFHPSRLELDTKEFDAKYDGPIFGGGVEENLAQCERTLALENKT